MPRGEGGQPPGGAAGPGEPLPLPGWRDALPPGERPRLEGGGQRGRRVRIFRIGVGPPLLHHPPPPPLRLLPRIGTAAFLRGHACAHTRTRRHTPARSLQGGRLAPRPPLPLAHTRCALGSPPCSPPSTARFLGRLVSPSPSVWLSSSPPPIPTARLSPLACHGGGGTEVLPWWGPKQVVETAPESFALQGLDSL